MDAIFDYWFPTDVNHLSGYYAALARLMPPAGKVLDLGCGCHHDFAQFRTPQREVWGTDFEVHPALEHPQWFRRIGPDGRLPFDDAAFDLVGTNMVLEHVGDPVAFFAEVDRVLRPGGYFIGHSISGLHYVTWLRRAIGLLPHSWNQRLVKRLYGRDEHDTFPAYYRLSTPRRIRRTAAPFGLRLVEVNRYASQGYFEFSPVLWRLAVVTDWLLDRLVPGMGRIYFSAVLQKPAIAATAPVRRAA